MLMKRMSIILNVKGPFDESTFCFRQAFTFRNSVIIFAMQIIDSHCHIDRVDLDAFGGSIESMLEHAEGLSVSKFLCVCIDLEHFDQVHNLALAHPSIFASVGVHPTETNCKDPEVDELLVYAKSDRVIAIGETGLDYFHIKKDDADWQRERFRRHISASNNVR